MPTYQPRTPHSDSIRPDCPKCGKQLNPDQEKPGHELLTFVCDQCSYIETAIGKAH